MLGVAIVVFIVAIFVLVCYQTVRAQLRAAPEEIDLSTVCQAMVEKHGWDADRAAAAQAEYVRFLILLQKNPGFILVPWLDAKGRDHLDQFWHQHILDTEKYAADCKLLFGRMIHHNPHIVRGSEVEGDAVLKTQRLYARTFNSGAYGAEADPALMSGCGACAAVSGGHSDGPGGHDGGWGGHDGGGGHSCGGHGCGGHGCGSSCGGH
jgi:hypothetical protein